jgi:uncharacterized membrane protein
MADNLTLRLPLKHDSSGFLIGDPVEIAGALNVIGQDVRAIRQAIIAGKRVPAKAALFAEPAGDSQTPVRAAALPRVSRAKKSPDADAVVAIEAVEAIRSVAKRAAPALPRGKDGRWQGSGKQEKPAAPKKPEDGKKDKKKDDKDKDKGKKKKNGKKKNEDESSVLQDVGDRVATAVKEATDGMRDVDPSVKAFEEVAQPLQRGFDLLRPEPDEKGWLKRIFKRITKFFKRDEKDKKAVKKSLKTLEKKKGEGGGIFGKLFGLLSKLPIVGALIPAIGGLVGALTKFIPFLPGRPGGGATPTGKGGKGGKPPPVATTSEGAPKGAVPGKPGAKPAAKRFPKLRGFGRNLAKFGSRIPFVGAAVTTGLAAYDIVDAKQDQTLSKDEKDKRIGGAVGGAAGSIAGTVAGAKVGVALGAAVGSVVPVVGTAVGAAVGGLIGSLAGGWLGYEGGQMAGEKLGGMKSAARVPASASVPAGGHWNDAQGHLVSAANKAGVDAGILAKIANFESGFNSEAAPIKDGRRLSSAHGYGQFIDGTWLSMLRKHGGKYGIANAGKLTQEEANKLRGDKDLQAAMLAEFTRENVEIGRALGGKDDDANVYAMHNLGRGDGERLLNALRANPSMSVRDALLAGANSKEARARVDRIIKNNPALFGRGDKTVTDVYTTMGRAMRRGEAYAVLARQTQQASLTGFPTLATPAQASLPTPRAPTPPTPPAIAESPAVAEPLGSGKSATRVSVNVPAPEAGQDVRDRGIAHVVTGGLAA